MSKSQFNNMTLDIGDMRKEEKYSFIDARDASKPVLAPDNDSSGTCTYAMTTKKLLEKRRNVYPLCGLLLGGVLIIWLIGLTMVREFQLSALRQDVEKLRADVDELKMQNKYDEGLMDDLKGFEDQMDSEDNSVTSTHGTIDAGYEEEEEEEEDDDDFNNDYYSEDDSSEYTDFLGETMEANVVDKSKAINGDEHPPIKKIMKIWKKIDDVIDDETEHDRSKREVIGETANGVPVIAESYMEARAKNMTHRSNQRIVPYQYNTQYHDQAPKMILDWETEQAPMELKRRQHKKANMLTSTEAPAPVYTRESRVMSTNEDKSKSFRKLVRIQKPITKVGLSADYDAAYLKKKPEVIGVTRIHRPRKSHNPNARRNLENVEELEISESVTPRRRPRPPMVAHFNGDTTNYSTEKHEHYDGNGRLRHPHDVPYTAWSAAPWLSYMDIDTYFRLQDGAVSVPANGLYFVYSQIYFHDAHDTNGFQVFRNNGVRDESILQCTTMTHSTVTMEKSNTCYTAGAFHLNKGDTIFVKNLGSMRYSIMQPGKSFFGLFKLSDLRVR